MRHKISISLPSRPIENVDAKIEVMADKKLLGRLKISKGSLDWTPNGHDDDKPCTISWSKFDKFMQMNTKRKNK